MAAAFSLTAFSAFTFNSSCRRAAFTASISAAFAAARLKRNGAIISADGSNPATRLLGSIGVPAAFLSHGRATVVGILPVERILRYASCLLALIISPLGSAPAMRVVDNIRNCFAAPSMADANERVAAGK